MEFHDSLTLKIVSLVGPCRPSNILRCDGIRVRFLPRSTVNGNHNIMKSWKRVEKGKKRQAARHEIIFSFSISLRFTGSDSPEFNNPFLYWLVASETTSTSWFGRSFLILKKWKFSKLWKWDDPRDKDGIREARLFLGSPKKFSKVDLFGSTVNSSSSRCF